MKSHSEFTLEAAKCLTRASAFQFRAHKSVGDNYRASDSLVDARECAVIRNRYAKRLAVKQSESGGER